ncbi:hypothetical protein JAAARDRAFT_190847 [Jaapia argillacea MUCL 33604]|uniref:Translocation protein sec66 n=1 Tax=Jaapia argillacea MUCL 33604 TaxID=933084 RepID=A0A067QB05_9AGAM|nr:hypothetical protein JAAARDRAFT_190847 [Jaapia argillacea MUCL 33604]
MASVLVPVLYLVLVIGGMLVFGYYYRKRAAAKRFEPYFPSHPERDQYVSLLQQSDPPANEVLLKAALIRRAMADVQRILRIREDKPALQNLLQKGSIGDDLWNSIVAAEKELEAEIMEVIAEANTFVEGWGQLIFQTATEAVHNEKIRALFEATGVARAEKELKYGKKPKKLTGSHPPARVTSPKPTPASPSPAVTAQDTPSHSNSNGLAPPPTRNLEDSSDAESVLSASGRSAKSGKKGKKRK